MLSISHYSQFSKQHHRPLISFGQNSFKEQVDLLCELTLVLQSLRTKTISCSHIYKQLHAWFLSSYKTRYHFAVLWVFVELSKLCQQDWCLVHPFLRLKCSRSAAKCENRNWPRYSSDGNASYSTGIAYYRAILVPPKSKLPGKLMNFLLTIFIETYYHRYGQQLLKLAKCFLSLALHWKPDTSETLWTVIVNIFSKIQFSCFCYIPCFLMR